MSKMIDENDWILPSWIGSTERPERYVWLVTDQWKKPRGVFSSRELVDYYTCRFPNDGFLIEECEIDGEI